MHAHFAGFEQTRSCAERAGNVRRREAAGFDVARVAEAAQLAVLFRFLLAGGEAFHVREFQRAVRGMVS